MTSRRLLNLLCLLGALVFSPSVWAAITVTLSSSDNRIYCANEGSHLQEGSIVRVGTFDLSTESNRSLVKYSTDFAAVDTLFKPLGERLPNSGTVVQRGAVDQTLRISSQFGNGTVFGQIRDIVATHVSTNTRLYIWVFNAPTIDEATEWGIFSASRGWATPTDFGSQTLATSEIDDAIRGTIEKSKFSLSPHDAGFRNWAVSALGNVEENSPADDPDGDGLTNLMEYAFLFDPVVAELPSPMNSPLSIVSSTNAFKIQVALPIIRSDLNYAVETSEDLKVWTDTGLINLANGGAAHGVDLDASTSTRFARLRISIK